MSQKKLCQPVPVKKCTVILNNKTKDPIDLWVDPGSNRVKTVRGGVYNKDFDSLLSEPNVQVVARYG